MSDVTLEIVKIAGASTAFVIGLLQYMKSQRWKRAEFVANEVKEFNALPEVRNAKLMLDYTERYVDLFPEKEKADERRVDVTEAMVVSALKPHGKQTEFKQAEARIRDTFDEFFGRLERFENFIAAGLVTKEECAPYIAYWIDILGIDGKDAPRPGLVKALSSYSGVRIRRR